MRSDVLFSDPAISFTALWRANVKVGKATREGWVSNNSLPWPVHLVRPCEPLYTESNDIDGVTGYDKLYYLFQECLCSFSIPSVMPLRLTSPSFFI